mmetsp:Transcript_10993/g.38723  ORF Transcript_10993/g.38723 Transcript_10993/m.38723 type:complete len:476 (-) Transcript_10993:171-1598(-)
MYGGPQPMYMGGHPGMLPHDSGFAGGRQLGQTQRQDVTSFMGLCNCASGTYAQFMQGFCGKATESHHTPMQYVGGGGDGGDWALENTYQYAGQGMGAGYVPENGLMYEEPRPSRCGVGCILGVVVVLAAVAGVAVLLVGVPALHKKGTVVETRVDTFNCDQDFDSWQTRWSDDQQAWCCSNALKGCPVTTATSYMAAGTPLAATKRPSSTVAPVEEGLIPAQDTKTTKTCIVWGAGPHISTFDRAFSDFNNEGEVWLVKSTEVHIQAKFLKIKNTHGLALTRAVAVGGPFMQGHIMKISPLEDGGHIWWDDQEVLATDGSFDLSGLGKATYDGMGGAYQTVEAKHVVHLALNLGVNLEVMRWSSHVSVKIDMLPQAGQDGYCGNFNDQEFDDSFVEVKQRLGLKVAKQDMLFEFIAWTTRNNRVPVIDDCLAKGREAARQQCMGSRSDLAPEMLDRCIYDVCFGGVAFAQEDVMY